ncbi:MAG: lipopolysaccharide kinase InaA family protein [Thermodesulfobacteriota bacterium]
MGESQGAVMLRNTPASAKIEDIMRSLERGECVRRIEGKREVWRVVTFDGAYYLKRSFCRGFLKGVLSFFGVRTLLAEVCMAEDLEKIGVPVPRVVTYGEVPNARTEFMVTSEVEGATTLKEFFFTRFPRLSLCEKRQAAKDLALFFRSLHDLGVVHNDPHMGNILIGRKAGRFAFYLIDLGAVSINGRLGAAERWKNLVLLNVNFAGNAADSLRAYFFKVYSEGLLRHEERRGVTEDIERRSSLLAARIWKKKAAKCIGANNVFSRVQSGALAGFAKKEWMGTEGMGALLRAPDEFLDGPAATVLKNGCGVKAAAVTLPGGGRAMLKRYNGKGFFRALENIFCAGRAAREWRNAYAAELRGLNVPRPLAYMEERAGIFSRKSYVITELACSSATLGRFIGNGYMTMNDAEKEEFFFALGKEIGRMHRRGFSHGDLKWSSILVKEGTVPVFYFTDIDGSRVEEKLGLSRVKDDVERFSREMRSYGISKASRLAFFEGHAAKFRVRGLPISIF